MANSQECLLFRQFGSRCMKLLAYVDCLLLFTFADFDILQKFVRNQLQRILRPRLHAARKQHDNIQYVERYKPI